MCGNGVCALEFEHILQVPWVKGVKRREDGIFGTVWKSRIVEELYV